MLKQISVEQLKDEALVLSEVDVLDQPDNVMLISGVFFHQEAQELAFLLCKFMIDLSVSVDLNRNSHASHVINSRDHLSKTAFAQDFKHFKSIEDLILSFDNVVPVFIVLIGLSLGWTLPGWHIWCIINHIIC